MEKILSAHESQEIQSALEVLPLQELHLGNGGRDSGERSEDRAPMAQRSLH